MLAGAYPSDEFAELKAAWSGTAKREVRDGAMPAPWQSRAWHDPGSRAYPVFLVGEAGRPAAVSANWTRRWSTRARGEVIALGATSWRVEEIRPDRVVVSPAPGVRQDPFWHGDGLGRPIELVAPSAPSPANSRRTWRGERARERASAAPRDQTWTTGHRQRPGISADERESAATCRPTADRGRAVPG